MLKLLDNFRKKRRLSAVKEEDPTDNDEIPYDIMQAISKMRLAPDQTVIVTVSRKTVTRERQDPLSGGTQLLSRDTTQTHKLSIIKSG